MGLALMAVGLYVERNITDQELVGEQVYLVGLALLIASIVFGSLRVGVRAKRRR